MLSSDPTDKSVGYVHSSAARTEKKDSRFISCGQRRTFGWDYGSRIH